MPAHKPMGPADWGLLVGLSLLWGGSFFLTGIAVREVPAMTIVAIRVGVAALALLGVLGVLGMPIPLQRRFWIACLGMGVLNNVVPFSLFAWAQAQIPSALAAILNATTPLFAVLVAHALTEDEKASPAKLVGVVTGFLGVAVMIGPGVLAGGAATLLPQLAALAAAISYALSAVWGRRFEAFGLSPVVIAAGQLTASTVLLLPVCLVVDRPWSVPLPSPGALAALLALALLATSLAYILFFRILASAGATNLMLVTFLIPVSAILLGSLFLGERLEPRHFAGMALIGLGLAAIDGRAVARLRRPR